MAALDSLKNRPAAKAEEAAKPFEIFGVLDFLEDFWPLDLANASGFSAIASRCSLAEELLLWLVLEVWAGVSVCAHAVQPQAVSTTAKAMLAQDLWALSGGIGRGCGCMRRQFKRRIGS